MKLALSLTILMMSTLAYASDEALMGGASSGTSTTSSREYVPKGQSIISRVIPEISLNVSTLAGTYSGSEGISSKTGFGVGIITDIGRSDFVFETGFLYRQMGAGGSGTSNTLDLNYISFPLLGKYYFNGQDNDSFYFHAGPLPSINVAHSANINNTSYNVTDVSTFDFQLMGGFGGKLEIGDKVSLVLEADYFRGLSQVADSLPAYNSGFTFLTGVGIEL